MKHSLFAICCALLYMLAANPGTRTFLGFVALSWPTLEQCSPQGLAPDFPATAGVVGTYLSTATKKGDAVCLSEPFSALSNEVELEFFFLIRIDVQTRSLLSLALSRALMCSASLQSLRRRALRSQAFAASASLFPQSLSDSLCACASLIAIPHQLTAGLP